MLDVKLLKKDYLPKFRDLVESMSDEDLAEIGDSRWDIYFDGTDFYKWPHDIRNDYGHFKVFDSEAGEPFDAKSALNDFLEILNDTMIQYEGSLEN